MLLLTSFTSALLIVCNLGTSLGAKANLFIMCEKLVNGFGTSLFNGRGAEMTTRSCVGFCRFIGPESMHFEKKCGLHHSLFPEGEIVSTRSIDAVVQDPVFCCISRVF